jgi:hypothetical protein
MIESVLRFEGTVQLELATKVITQLLPETTAVLTPLTVWLVQAELARALSSIAPRENMLATRKAGMPSLTRRLNRGFFFRFLKLIARPEFVLGKKRLGSKAPPGRAKPLKSGLPNTRSSI